MTTAQSNGALSLPEGFTWGAATAAYQVEGAARADGRGVSVWDTFSASPGNVRGGDTGEVACDSYHRYAEDVGLLSSLGLRAYRFSISWPRVQPGGRGPVNQHGLDYYRRLLDELAGHDIEPTATLYHWDLPQELQDAGGWTVRDTADRFAEYTAIMAEALGDRVARWITINEPQVVASHGYRTGEHAPGIRDNAAAVAATHHLLVAHGLAAQVLRAAIGERAQVGISLDMHPVKLLGESTENLDLGRQITDANLNGLFLEPLLHGSYPALADPSLVPAAELIRDGDMELIRQPLDFLGVNYYAAVYLRTGDPDDLRRNEKKAKCNVPGVVEYRPGWLGRTPMGWIIDAEGLYDLLMGLATDAPGLPVYVTENGCAAEDYVNPLGVINDLERIKYLHEHLAAAARATHDGANLAGYFVWSLLDNFEWGWGYQKRFGIVYVDFATGERTPKSSANFYAGIAAANKVPSLPNGPVTRSADLLNRLMAED